MAKGAPEIDVRSNLGPVLADLKEISAKLARDVRRDIRSSGDTMITESRRALDGGDVAKVVTVTTYRRRGPGEGTRGGYRRGPRARALGGQVIDQIEVRNARHKHEKTDAIAEVKKGLVTRISISKTRGARVRMQTTKGELKRALNMKKFRHPVYAEQGSEWYQNGPWIEQRGAEYFKRGVTAGGREARERLQATLREAMETVKNHNPQ